MYHGALGSDSDALTAAQCYVYHRVPYCPTVDGVRGHEASADMSGVVNFLNFGITASRCGDPLGAFSTSSGGPDGGLYAMAQERSDWDSEDASFYSGENPIGEAYVNAYMSSLYELKTDAVIKASAASIRRMFDEKSAPHIIRSMCINIALHAPKLRVDDRWVDVVIKANMALKPMRRWTQRNIVDWDARTAGLMQFRDASMAMVRKFVGASSPELVEIRECAEKAASEGGNEARDSDSKDVEWDLHYARAFNQTVI